MERIEHIDGLRAFFSLAIVLYHFQLAWFFPGSHIAVDYFFVLSGFILGHVYLPRMDRISFGDFAVARFARLWPLHAFTLVLYGLVLFVTNFLINGTYMFGVDKEGSELVSAVEHLLLIQNVGFQEDLTWNFPSWSISVEFWVNMVLFGVLALLASPANRTLAVILSVVIILASFVTLSEAIGDLSGRKGILPNLGGFLNTGLVRGFGGIFLGLVAFLIWHFFHERRAAPLGLIGYGLKTVFELVLFGAIAANIFGPHMGEFEILSIFLFAMLIVSLGLGRPTLVQFGFSIWPMRALGTISYGMYLGHASLLFVFKQWDKLTGMSLDPRILAVAYLATTILLATALYYLIEKPAQRWIKRRLQTVTSRSPAEAQTAP